MNYYNWIIPIILLLLTSGYYIGKKFQTLIQLQKKKSKFIYWVLIYLFTTISFLFRTILVGFFFYFILLNLLFTITKGLFQLLKKEEIINFLNKIYFHGIPIFIICIITSIYGLYNITHPIIKEYNIKLETKLKENLTIGMISDFHLGNLHNDKFLKKTIMQINNLNADIFIFCGDIFDEYTKQNLKEKAIQEFSKIKTKYGIYYIEGNHDLLNQETISLLKENNINILNDDVIQIANNINLIGRKDDRNNRLGNKRKTIEELLENADKSLPVILIDHQPKEEKIAESLNIDLQLSGHTHAGQIFPANFFLEHGYQKRNNFQIIVSSGYGAWGFPVRTIGRSEIIKVNLTN